MEKKMMTKNEISERTLIVQRCVEREWGLTIRSYLKAVQKYKYSNLVRDYYKVSNYEKRLNNLNHRLEIIRQYEEKFGNNL